MEGTYPIEASDRQHSPLVVASQHEDGRTKDFPSAWFDKGTKR